MPDHRCERLLERYGLIMTPREVDALAPLCGPVNRLQRGDHGDVHLIHRNGVDLVIVIRDFADGRGRVVCTFMAPDYFTAGRRARDRDAATTKAGRLTSWRREYRLRKRQLGRAEG